MPEGSPSGHGNDDDSDSDDSIVMPEGDAPPEARLAPAPGKLQSYRTWSIFRSPQDVIGPRIPLMTPAGPPMFAPYRPAYGHPPFNPNHNFRPPHPGFGTGSNHMPLPPPGFFPNNARPQHFQPGFRPPHLRPGVVHQDPLSNVPHTTFQAHQVAKQEEAASSVDKPASVGNAPPVAAVIEAAPQIRDLRKEAAAFVPRAAKKKKTAAAAIQIDAAPPPESQPGETLAENQKAIAAAADETPAAPPAPVYNPAAGGLMGKLSGILGSAPAPAKPADDYQSFLAGLDELPQ